MCRLLGRVFIRIYESISFSLDVCNVTVASEIDDSEKVNLEQPGTIEEMNQSHDVHTQSPRNIVPKLPERVISKKRGNIPLNSFNSKYPETQNIPIFLVYGYLKQTIASKAKMNRMSQISSAKCAGLSTSENHMFIDVHDEKQA